MLYKDIVEIYEKLEKTSAKLGKRDILVDLLSKIPTELLPKVVLLSIGRVFPSYSELKTGIATKMMIRAISKATGLHEKEIVQKFKELGDLGLVAEQCIKEKKQVSLFKKELTVELVFEDLQKLATLTGAGSQEKKLNLIAELLVSSQPKEARYIVRTTLEMLRIGVAEGIVRDAIAKAFTVDAKLVENAWFLNPNYGDIAKIAKEKKNKGLKSVKPKIGRPIYSMEAIKEPDFRAIMKEGKEYCIEEKYDGYKLQVHKKGDEITLFTRRQENVTSAFPDLIEPVKNSLKSKNCIVEGECIAIDPKTHRQRPFQFVSRRIKRKYYIQKTIKSIPVELKIFDVILIEKKSMLDSPLIKRRKSLEKIIKEIPRKITLSNHIITDSLKEAERFYKEVLKAGYEGVMVKEVDAHYQPGRRVGFQYKLKPTLEPLDLVIIEATWGEGKRAKWLSSYTLACRDQNTGKLLKCGMMGSGLTEKQFDDMTKILKKLIIREEGRIVILKPKIVVEVEYEEIQKSPNYNSGYALRFPRLKRIRDDKKLEEADSIKRVESIFKIQRGQK